MYQPFSFILLSFFWLQAGLTLLSPVYAESQSEPLTEESSCILNEISAWDACINKEVKLSGRLTPPEKIMQHPQLVFPEMPIAPEQMEEQPVSQFVVQDYMDVENRGQIILLAKTAMNCPEQLTVTGILEQLDLGGEKGTKNSYQGWIIRVDSYQCFLRGEKHYKNCIVFTNYPFKMRKMVT